MNLAMVTQSMNLPGLILMAPATMVTTVSTPGIAVVRRVADPYFSKNRSARSRRSCLS